MTDKELLRTLIFLKEWTQEELARVLQFDRSNISRVIKEKQKLPKKRRTLAEQLLDELLRHAPPSK